MGKLLKLNTSKTKRRELGEALESIGTFLLLGALWVAFFTLGPVYFKEISYETNKITKVSYTVETPQNKNEIQLTPPNTNFSIIIPKIGAVAPVSINVDPSNEEIYKKALLKGVAHAKGTALPGEIGNTYIFAHSTDSFYNVGRYNAVFYLLGKLKQGDEINVYFQNERYVYTVDEVKVVEANDVKYLGKIGQGSTLTLQTCYPPGTTLKRLIVVSHLIEK